MEKMKKYKFIILLLVGFCFVFGFEPTFAQSNARIENTDFYQDGSNLIITYDIVKAKAGETFNIWVKVTGDSGTEIIPSAVSGDVGKGVPGGSDKRVIWDMETDNAFIDEEISVEIFARSEGVKQSGTEEKVIVPKTEGSGISVIGAMGLSVILPGLGNRVAKGSGAQWLLGVVGYGCIAGSVVMNNSAYNTYEDYKVATTPQERDDLFNQAKTQNTVSKVFLGAAIIIWAGDLLWTGLQAGSVRKKAGKSDVSFISSFDPYTKRPLFGINYRF